MALLEALGGFGAKFRRTRELDTLLSIPVIADVTRQLNDICLANGILAYHYTRAYRDRIAADGLVVGTGDDRRAEFLLTHGHLFTPDQLFAIRSAWEGYFDRIQNAGRDGRAWFSPSLAPLKERGIERLLKYFGGEVIYMPLVSIPSVAKVLEGIGRPLVVKARLDASRTYAFGEVPWGRIWLSAYHRILNRRAYPVLPDLRVQEDVAAGKILTITDATELGWHP